MSPLPGLGLAPALCIPIALAWVGLVIAVVRPTKPVLVIDSVALLSLAGIPLLAGNESASFRYVLFMLGIGSILPSIITYRSRTHRSFPARLLVVEFA